MDVSFFYTSDWESMCIYDSRYGIELFNYDLLHPTSFNDYSDEDDSNGQCITITELSELCLI